MSSHGNEWERFTMPPPNSEGRLRRGHGHVSGAPEPCGKEAPPLRREGQGDPRCPINSYQEADNRHRDSSVSGSMGIARDQVYPGATGSGGRLVASSGETGRVGHVHQESSQYGSTSFRHGGREHTHDPNRGFGSGFPVDRSSWGAVPDPHPDPRPRPEAVHVRTEAFFSTDNREVVPAGHRTRGGASGSQQERVYECRYNSAENEYNEPPPHCRYRERSPMRDRHHQPRDNGFHYYQAPFPHSGTESYRSAPRPDQNNMLEYARDFDKDGDYWRPASVRGRGWDRGSRAQTSANVSVREAPPLHTGTGIQNFWTILPLTTPVLGSLVPAAPILTEIQEILFRTAPALQ
ncbi:hypothetical protein C7212DRAFT_343897 [Tuber magnatum]|uniref:Uncharacterized protein n=1 Tax=Tuber magnatum TaxID=42249 RepID=A0A317STB6_9PEZI|nr:hypothetical protein C7212DRAFT_343897 [Tuber magnatum]